MFGIHTAPLVALWAILAVADVQAGPIPHSGSAGLSSRSNHHDGTSCWNQGRRGSYRDGLCIDLDVNLDVSVHKRASGPHRFSNYYADRTPCWVDGRRGWMKDHTCGDLVDIDASIKIGKRFHSFDDPYFANGTPCFHNGRQGLLQDLLCAVVSPPARFMFRKPDIQIDVDVGDRYDNGWAGPWRFNSFYEEGRPCWVDQRRGYIHDQSCGNLIDIDADLSIGRRYYKDDPYFLDGVPCLEKGKEGVLDNYMCLAADVHIQKRGYWGYYQGSHGLLDGAPCWQDGRQGVVGGLLCVVADVQIGKRRLLGPPDGDSCFREGRWGAFRDGDCFEVDVDADVQVAKRGLLGSGQGDILRNVLSSGPGHKGELLGGILGVTGGDHGKHYPSNYGHYFEDELVDAAADIDVDSLNVKRGYYDPDELMAEIEAEAEINADSIIYAKRHYHDDVLDIKADVKVDADVDAVHHGHRYHKRSGLLNNKNGVEGAVGTIGKTTHNTLGARAFGHGQGYEHNHNVADVDAKVDVDVDVNADHRHGTLLSRGSLLLGNQQPGLRPAQGGFGRTKGKVIKEIMQGLGKNIQ